jgi:hypothetical protein
VIGVALLFCACEDGRGVESVGRAVDETIEEIEAGGHEIVEEGERAVDQANRAISKGVQATREAAGDAVDDLNRAIGEASRVFDRDGD